MEPPKDPRHPANNGNRTIEAHDPADIDRRRGEQAHQMDDVGGTPTTPTLPQPMSNGMFMGAAIGAVVGALLLSPRAFANILDLDFPIRLVIVLIAGAAAGATLGAVFLAGAQAEAANPENDEYIYADGASSERQEGPGVSGPQHD